jgi:hypothetical protein
VETGCSFSYSQEPATCYYPESDYSNPQSPPVATILSQITATHRARHLLLSWARLQQPTEPATCYYPEPDYSNPQSPPVTPILSQITATHRARQLLLSWARLQQPTDPHLNSLRPSEHYISIYTLVFQHHPSPHPFAKKTPPRPPSFDHPDNIWRGL